MARLLFIALHLVAIGMGGWLLFITIPAHLIYASVTRGDDDAPDIGRTHLKCPDCKEAVLREANVCKHCGCKLMPRP